MFWICPLFPLPNVLTWTDAVTFPAHDPLLDIFWSAWFPPERGGVKGAAASQEGSSQSPPLTHLLSGPPSRPRPIHLCLCSPRALENGTQSTQNQSRTLQLVWMNMSSGAGQASAKTPASRWSENNRRRWSSLIFDMKTVIYSSDCQNMLVTVQLLVHIIFKCEKQKTAISTTPFWVLFLCRLVPWLWEGHAAACVPAPASAAVD